METVFELFDEHHLFQWLQLWGQIIGQQGDRYGIINNIQGLQDKKTMLWIDGDKQLNKKSL